MSEMVREPLETLLDAWRAYRRAELGQLNVTAEKLREAAGAAGWIRGVGEGGFAPWACRRLIAAGLISASEGVSQ